MPLTSCILIYDKLYKLKFAGVAIERRFAGEMAVM